MVLVRCIQPPVRVESSCAHHGGGVLLAFTPEAPTLDLCDCCARLLLLHPDTFRLAEASA